ncbi:MAG: glycosyltransferase family A protein, partial [Sulfurovaceae bacterium]
MYQLSIIIPHFNSSKMLKTLLDTIPTNKDVEVIIVDDKSEKKHIEYIEKILKEKEDHRIRFCLKNELYIRYKMHSPWLKIVQSKFLKTYNIQFQEVIASTDVMFSTNVGYHMKHFDISKDIIYIITRNAGSLTVNYTKEVIESRAKVLILWYRFLKERLSKEELELLDIEGLHLLSLSFYNSLSMLL